MAFVTDPIFTDLDAFVAQPRVTGLVLSLDGRRLVATVSAPDRKGAAYVSALWEIYVDGARHPERLTFSAKGESAPAFLPDGSLLFASARPDPQDPDAEETALWRLPPAGEAAVVARTSGGLGSPEVAAQSGTILTTGSRLMGSGDEAEDEQRRKTRRDTKVTAILHDGMPIRYWDSELDDTSARLFVTDLDGGTRDLVPDARYQLRGGDLDLSADGTVVLATWTVRAAEGTTEDTLVAVDVATGRRTALLAEPGVDFGGPRLDPAGRRYAVIRRVRGTFETPHVSVLQIHVVDGSTEPLEVDLGDLTPGEYAWSPDGSILWVTGDLHSAGAVLGVDPAGGHVTTRLADDASYSLLRPSPDGTTVYALRSAIDHPPTPVRLDVTQQDQEPTFLLSPGAVGDLPGTLKWVEHDLDGVAVPGWLCLPDTDGPAPLMTWIHGGPFASWNAWSWRWSPWLAVARGWAVLLPDPALSTGYGAESLARAWPHRAGIVWREIEDLIDGVLSAADLDLDPTRTALLGASFGGYLTNWVAGHTDRFGAIVSHAGLWALDQQHKTTDLAELKTGIFGTPVEHPEWYAENSPDRFATNISTPMLVVHGNRDYRVPISEALRLWWDLVSLWPGEPDRLPHRFLQLTGENHWVLSPANAKVWYDTVLAFCDHHVRGGPPLP